MLAHLAAYLTALLYPIHTAPCCTQGSAHMSIGLRHINCQVTMTQLTHSHQQVYLLSYSHTCHPPLVPGGSFAESLSKIGTTHLMAIKAAGDKARVARKWGLPMVTPSWLIDSAYAGVALDPTKCAAGAAWQHTYAWGWQLSAACLWHACLYVAWPSARGS